MYPKNQYPYTYSPVVLRRCMGCNEQDYHWHPARRIYVGKEVNGRGMNRMCGIGPDLHLLLLFYLKLRSRHLYPFAQVH